MFSRIAKSPAADFEAIHRVADRLEPTLRRQFLEAVEQLRQLVPVNEITEALEAGNLGAVLRAMEVDIPPELSEGIRDTLTRVAAETGRVTAAEFGINLAIANTRAAEWASRYAGQLIVGINDETRQAVRQIVSDAILQGRAPRDQARDIARIVGMTERDAGVFQRFMAGLRDSGATREWIDRRAERERSRLLRRRAETIARTETIRAANTGQQRMWTEAADQGLIAHTSRQVWIVTPDDRLCPICAPLEGATVGLGESWSITEQAEGFDIASTAAFVADDEAVGGARRARDRVSVSGLKPLKDTLVVDGPPAHPRCRCAVGLEVEEVADSIRSTTDLPAPLLEGLPDRQRGQFASGSRRLEITENAIAEQAEGLGLTRDEYVTRAVRDHQTMVNEAQVVVHVPNDETLQAILQDGRFKSQFETNTSKGSLAPDIRRQQERVLFGYDLDLPDPQRPIYATLGTQGKTTFASGAYGEVRVILDPSVKRRATFTGGDSLAGAAMPSPMSDIDWTAIPWANSGSNSWINVDPLSPPTGMYYETQIHGGVKVGDIAEVVFRSPPDDEVVRLLEDRRIRWRMDK